MPIFYSVSIFKSLLKYISKAIQLFFLFFFFEGSTQHTMYLVYLTLCCMHLSSVRSCVCDRCFLSQRNMKDMMSLSTGALYFVLLGCHKLYCHWECQLASKQRLFKNQEGNRYCCLFLSFSPLLSHFLSLWCACIYIDTCTDTHAHKYKVIG